MGYSFRNPHHHFLLLLPLLLLPPTQIPPTPTTPSHPPVLQNPAILILAHTRLTHLRRLLNSYTNLPQSHRQNFTLYVSLDHSPRANTIRRILDTTFSDIITEIWIKPGDEDDGLGKRGRIARHYLWGLDRVFEEKRHSGVIILEEDLVLCDDFLWYFLEVGGVLDMDRSLMCVSAWNDNSFRGVVWDKGGLLRTDYFPGLGWMIGRGFWMEGLGKKWREEVGRMVTGWDHWVRVVVRGECVCPEVARVRHVDMGKGVNVGEVEGGLLGRMVSVGDFEEEKGGFVEFGDVRWLVGEKYREWVGEVLRKGLEEGGGIVLRGRDGSRSLDEVIDLKEGRKGKGMKTRVVLYLREDYREMVAKPLGIFPVPRGHYQHTIVLHVSPGVVWVLADQRRSPYLPEDLRVPPPVDLAQVIAPANTSCSAKCSQHGWVCLESNLEWINSCNVMKRLNKGCRRGCGLETGSDLPAIVVEDSGGKVMTDGMCLVAEDGYPKGGKLSCKGRHALTRRVCGCVRRAPLLANAP